MKKRSLLKITALFTAAALSSAGAANVSASDDSPNRVDELIDYIWFGEWPEYEPEDEPEDTYAELPSKYDLRDVDGVCYVPEIRSQDPFGTCWSFGAIAAAEISLAYQLGIDFNTADDYEKEAIDLSEKHLAWFSYTPLPDNSPFYNSQSGEGYYYNADGTDSEEKTQIPYDFGGYAHYAAVLFSEGVGPTFESEVPYINSEGKWNAEICAITITEDDYREDDYRYEKVAPDEESINAFIAEYEKDHPGMKDYNTEYDGSPGVYYRLTIQRTADGDWSVDESKRFQSIFLRHSNILPSPATMGPDGEYLYNEKATLAIKRELYEGRGVAVTMYSDHSRPGYTDDLDNAFLSFYTKDGTPAEFTDEADIWAHYTYCSGYDRNDPYSGNYCHSSNHAVCIVGYDDDFPKEYFNDPNGTIGGNGAWIARNSWGSRDNSDITARYDWGNGGDGYFYISYYDQSLDSAESYEFDLFAPEDEGVGLELYDLFPEFNYLTALSDEPVYMSNVFIAEDDEIIRDVGIMTTLPGLTARISVYLLEEGFTSPTDGRKVSETEEKFEYMGYHTMKLDSETAICEGQAYSVVLELMQGDDIYVFEINRAGNKAGYDDTEKWRKEWYLEDNGSLEGYEEELRAYGVMVVNEGESWLGAGYGDNTDWRDLTYVIEKFRLIDTDMTGGPFYDYDNFPIRSYPYASILEVKNSVPNEKEVYDEGDVIECIVTVDNYSALETYEDIELKCSLIDFGDECKIPKLGPGDNATVEYSYTVTEEDLGKGTLTSEISVYIGGELIDLNEQFSTLSFSVKVADKKPDAAEPEISGESGKDPGTADEEKPEEAAFPVLLFIILGTAALAAVVAVVTIVIVRKRKSKTGE